MSESQIQTPNGSPTMAPVPRVFVSAAEPSGDQHAAGLIAAISRICPSASFFGVAGPKMQAAGCEAMDNLTDRSAMLLGAIGLAGHAWRLLGQISKRLMNDRVDLAILTDSPALHLPMAKRIQAAGIPVLYYIAPQLWAWAPWRIRRVRRRVNRMAVILPFEETYFRDRGVDARFVGHPLLEQLASIGVDDTVARSLRAEGSPVVACLPGSRRHVIEEVLPGQIQVARAIAATYRNAVFLFSAASESGLQAIKAAMAHESFQWRVKTGQNAEILGAADLALCASGTATLEVAYHRVPMVIMYNGSKWGYRLVGRWLIRTPHLSLVNILAGRSIVPEFMPYYTSTEPIVSEAVDLLTNDKRRAAMKSDLDAMIQSLGTACAAEQTARIAIEMIGHHEAAGPSSQTPTAE